MRNEPGDPLKCNDYQKPIRLVGVSGHWPPEGLTDEGSRWFVFAGTQGEMVRLYRSSPVFSKCAAF